MPDFTASDGTTKCACHSQAVQIEQPAWDVVLAASPAVNGPAHPSSGRKSHRVVEAVAEVKSVAHVVLKVAAMPVAEESAEGFRRGLPEG